MIVHDRCKTPVMLDIDRLIKLITSYVVTDKGLRVNIGDMFIETPSGESQFYCTSCKTTVQQDHIEVLCNQCGNVVPYNMVFRSKTAGGMYCQTCIREYYPSDEYKVNIQRMFFEKKSRGSGSPSIAYTTERSS